MIISLNDNINKKDKWYIEQKFLVKKYNWLIIYNFIVYYKSQNVSWLCYRNKQFYF